MVEKMKTDVDRLILVLITGHLINNMILIMKNILPINFAKIELFFIF